MKLDHMHYCNLLDTWLEVLSELSGLGTVYQSINLGYRYNNV